MLACSGPLGPLSRTHTGEENCGKMCELGSPERYPFWQDADRTTRQSCLLCPSPAGSFGVRDEMIRGCWLGKKGPGRTKKERAALDFISPKYPGPFSARSITRAAAVAAQSATRVGCLRGSDGACRLLFCFYFLQQRRHVGPEFLTLFLLVRRQLGDGVRVADAGEVRVCLPAMERLADAGVLLGIIGELGPCGEVGAEPIHGLNAQAGALLDLKFGSISGVSSRAQSGAARRIVAVWPAQILSEFWISLKGF